jgi:MFS-type transporter involved in bile tolerance (Atg22 family)
MNTYILLAAESLICVAVSLAGLHAMSRPLMNVLSRICPDEQAASFWLTYTRLMLMLTPLLMVLLVDLFTRFSNPMDTLRLALIAALSGLLAGLYNVERRIGRYVSVPRKEEGVS